jgi:hypothetical protein
MEGLAIGDMTQLKLVPKYALKTSPNHRFSDASLYILPIHGVENVKIYHEKFSFDLQEHAYALQEALLQQRVIQHLGISVARTSPYVHKARQRLFLSSIKKLPALEEKA